MYPKHIYRTTNPEGETFENEDLATVQAWRDANAPGAPILDYEITLKQSWRVAIPGGARTFNVQEEAIAFRDAEYPGTPITPLEEEVESDPVTVNETQE